MSIWNSPADVSGTATVDDSSKKDNKGTVLNLMLNKMHFINPIASVFVYLCIKFVL